LLGQVAEASSDRAKAEAHYLEALAWAFDARLPVAMARVGPRRVTKVQRWTVITVPSTARNGAVRRLPWKTADEVAALDPGTPVYVEATVTMSSGTWCAVRKQPTDPPLGWVHRGITTL